MKPEDVSISIGPLAVADEIETWKETYGIEERYKALIIDEDVGHYWINQVLDEWVEDGRSQVYLRTLSRLTGINPLADTNFLKPFLEACNAKGLSAR